MHTPRQHTIGYAFQSLGLFTLLCASLCWTMCTAPLTQTKEATTEKADPGGKSDASTTDMVPPDRSRPLEQGPEAKPEPRREARTETPQDTAVREAVAEVPREASTPDHAPGTPYACPTIKSAPVPTQLKLDPFYKKYINAGGIPLIGSDKVPDAALAQAYYIVANMLANKPCIRKAIINSGIRIGIMAESEVTTNMPEYSDMNKAFPGTNWDTRGRGFGATLIRPLVSGAVENLLQKRSDRWYGENIFLHEFSHSFYEFGIFSLVDGRKDRTTLDTLYKNAIQAGLWDKTYAKTNANEYWAETVQSWFNSNLSADPPNGIHNNIDTRPELERYDPKMAAYITRFFDNTPWSNYCTTSGKGRPWTDPTPTDLSGVSCKLRRHFLADLGCPKLATLKSQSSATRLSLTIVNRSFNQSHKVDWINFQGKRQNYATLRPRSQRTLSTYAGHAWVVTNAQGQCVGAYTTTPHPSNIIAIER